MAPDARVVLFLTRILHRAGTVEREVWVRRLGRRFPVQFSASRARLNPKVHQSVSIRERSSGQPVLVVRPVPVIKFRLHCLQV